MIDISENLSSLISEDSRTFRVRLISGEKTYDEIRSFRKYIMFPSSSMSVGNTLSACIECTVSGIPASIVGSELHAGITTLGSDEWIELGSFRAEKPTVKDGDISFVAYDAMKTASEKKYESTLDEGAHTAQEYFTDICTVLGEKCKTLVETDGNLVIAEDKLSGYSCRDALAYLAGYLGKNCIVNREGLFEMIGFSAVGYNLLNEDRIAEPEFADSECIIGYINCCVDDETTLQSGDGSNGFEFISPIMTQERLDVVGDSVFGNDSVIRAYIPMKVTQLLGDPRIEICDVLTFEYEGTTYTIPIMSVSLEYDGGLMSIIESFPTTEPQSTSLGERLSFSQKQQKQKNNAYIGGIVEFVQLIQSAYGVKSTLLDGITYFHDKEKLVDSTYIFCITTEGFALANSWGGSHKDTVWKYGLSKDGNAILNMLNVFHLSASLIEAGILQSTDGSVCFDLDKAIISLLKKDSSGNTLLDVNISPNGIIGEAKKAVTFDEVTLTSSEIAELEKEYASNTAFLAVMKLAKRMLKYANMTMYGVVLTSNEADYSYRNHMSGNANVLSRFSGDSLDCESEYRADGMKVNGLVEGDVLGLGALTNVATNTDFNDFLTPGGFSIRTNAIAETITNIPLPVAGRLFVAGATGTAIASSGSAYWRQTFIPYQLKYPIFEREITRNSSNNLNVGSWIPTSLNGQKILWSGYSQMGNGVTIDLTEKISQQPNGITLVFSYVDSAGNAADYYYIHHPIEKSFVAAKTGASCVFHMNMHNYALVGSKLLYIHDEKIIGHADNTTKGTAQSGITYDNSRWMLRYILGR